MSRLASGRARRKKEGRLIGRLLARRWDARHLGMKQASMPRGPEWVVNLLDSVGYLDESVVRQALSTI